MSTNAYPVFFNSTALDSANGLIYTVPSSPTTIILQELQIKVVNTSEATHTVTIYAVPSGGAASTSNAAAINMSVPPYDYVLIPVPRMAAGGTVEGFADTASVLSVQPIGGKLHTP